MNVYKQAGDALTTCENGLRRVAAAALGQGDYTAARSVLSLAEAVSELRDRPDISPDRAPGAGASNARSSRNQSQGVTGDAAGGGSSGDAAGSSLPVRRARRQAYPRFTRRGDRLIKIGWSKSQKKEYEHKAPRSAVTAVATHLRSVTRNGKVFKIESLLPVSDAQDGGELPAYQVYLAIAWFREAGIIEKHGRDGYTATHAGLTEKAIAQQWNTLASEDI